MLTDKEEVGSDGVTGMNGEYAYAFLKELCAAFGADPIAAFRASRCLSADVTAALRPQLCRSVRAQQRHLRGPRHRDLQVHRLPRQELDPTTPPAELVSYLTRLLDKNSVAWQIGEMGKDRPGRRRHPSPNMSPTAALTPIDIGVPVLSMHSPFEVVSKADVYMAYLAFKSLLRRRRISAAA